MVTEREYRKWHKRNQKKNKRSRRGSGFGSIFLFLIFFSSIYIAYKNNPNLLSSVTQFAQYNSLKSLTREFITKTNEPVQPTAINNLEQVDFSTIDQIARNINYYGNSTSELADILSASAQSDVAKARIIYTWITHNIDYDVVALDNLFANNIYPDVTSQTVLENRATICSGYANLYQQLAQKMGLKSVIVLGYAKGGDYIVGEDNRVNHAWNAIQVDGHWYLMDTTWGAGIVNDGMFKPRFNPFYFATKPQEFIYTHFPEDDKWQLMHNLYSRAKFDNLPDVSADLFKNEIKLVSHQSEDITTEKNLTVVLEAPEDVVGIAKLSSEERSYPSNYTLVQRKGKNLIVSVGFPQQGDYQLDIFAKPKGGDKKYPLIVTYDISASNQSLPLPKTFANFSEHNGYLESPLQSDLADNQNAYFKIKIDNAIDVQVVNQSTNKWQRLNSYGNVFTGNIKINSGKNTVIAKFPGDSRYWALVEYE